MVISRSTPAAQPVPYTTSRGFQGSVEENSFDALTAMIQENNYGNTNAVSAPVGDVATDLVLPIVSLRASKVLAFDASGNVIASDQTLASIENGASSATASAAAAASSASAASGSATSAAQSAITAQAAAAGMQYRATRAGSTANVNIASAPSTLDGVTLVSLDRVLLQNQSTASQNGIYQFNGAGSAMTRTTDFNTWAQVPGTVVVVEEGTINGDKVFLCTSDVGGTLGTTAITFVNWSAVIFNNSITNILLALMTANSVKAAGSSGAASDIALAASQLMGRGASGDVAAITLGTNLSMSGTTLNSTGATAATQADMEAASSNTVFVTPAHAQSHPSAPKAWVIFDGTQGSPTAAAGYNIASITKNGTGDYTITFTIAFSSANYAIIGTPSGNTTFTHTLIVAEDHVPTASTCRFYTENSSSGTNLDCKFISLAFFGDQP